MKKIVAPTKIFAPEEVPELLRGWLVHARKEWKKHGEAARRLESQYRKVGDASVISSAIVGASLFASLETAYEPWGRIFAGILSISASVLSSLITFHRYEERTEKHRKAGVDHKAALRTLERMHATLKTSMPDPDSITKIEQNLDELEKSAPVVPQDIDSCVEQRYKEYTFDPTLGSTSEATSQDNRS